MKTYMGSPPDKGGGKKKKNLGINPEQPAGKGQKKRKKKTLVLTLGNPPEKGAKKNSGINSGQPARKGWGKKTLVLTLGSPPEKDEYLKKKKNSVGSAIENLCDDSATENAPRMLSDAPTHTQFVIIYKI
jgi:hypothetical protein